MASERKVSFIELIYEDGYAKGLAMEEKTYVEEMYDQGYAEGVAVARAGRTAKLILKLMDGRDLGPTEEQRQRVTSSRDSVLLALWPRRSMSASAAAEVFAD